MRNLRRVADPPAEAGVGDVDDRTAGCVEELPPVGEGGGQMLLLLLRTTTRVVVVVVQLSELAIIIIRPEGDPALVSAP